MQPLNDDMEDLYRRAGEDYPLNTEGANWPQVQQALYPGENNGQGKPKRDYRLLWLLLFLPFAFLCGRYTGNNSTVKTKGKPKETSAVTTTGKEAPNGKSDQVITENITDTSHEPEHKTFVKTGTGKDKLQAEKQLGLPGGNASVVNTTNTTTIARPTRKQVQTQAPVDEEHAASSTKNDVEEQPLSNNNVTTKQAATLNPGEKQPAIETGSTDTLSAGKETLPPQQPVAAKNDKASVASKVPVNKGWYYAITVAPDLSTVHFDRFKKMGYSAGILIGYQAGKRIRIETGMLWSNKYYYTAGEYIDTTKIKLPSHSTIKSAEGVCNMFEIPLGLQYDVYSGANSSVFIAGSLHSYLMKNEGYNINYKRYNLNYSADYKYINSTNNWFAVAGFSAGYRTALSKRATISFAPYIKLPLTGIGVGNLPVASTGINITIASFNR